MTYWEIIQAISQRLGCANASLPIDEDRDILLEQLRQQQIEQQRDEIAANGEWVRHAIKMVTAQIFKNDEDLKSDLFEDWWRNIAYSALG